jgi:hypothetical protein
MFEKISLATAEAHRWAMDLMSDRFIRAVFTVYWVDVPPSTEIFYIPMSYNPDKPAVYIESSTSIAAIEAKVLALINTTKMTTRAYQVIFVSDRPIRLSANEIASAGWAVISG